MAEPAMEIDSSSPSHAAPPPTTSNSNPSDPHTTEGAVAVRSIEGWIVLATNIHEEAAEEDLMDVFGEWGEVKNLHMNLDRRTGFVKGYALVEYPTLGEARKAVEGAREGVKVLDQTIGVDFAFVRPGPTGEKGGKGAARRGRSRSPEKREED